MENQRQTDCQGAVQHTGRDYASFIARSARWVSVFAGGFERATQEVAVYYS